MGLIEQVKEKARKSPERIVLAEGEDERVIRAAALCQEQGIVFPIILGSKEQIQNLASLLDIDLNGVEIVDPENSSEMGRYVSLYIDSREGKRVNERMVQRLLKRPLYFGAAMVGAGDVDAMVAGCTSLTATVVKAGELLVGLKDDISAPSSFFVMSVPDCPYGENGNFIYADAGVNPDPSPSELAEIAILSAESARNLLGWDPRVAVLSFSTKGSAGHKLADKVVEAVRLARKIAPDLSIDGEFQLDAAIVPRVAEKKVKDHSDVAGRANILIFPDLNAGNIAYKITQYLAGAEAYGPLLQGFKVPVNDLSRGASVADIVGVIAFTVIQINN